MESRVVIFAPTGKDAKLIAKVLERAKISSYVCARAAEIPEQIQLGAGALMLVDEAFDGPLAKTLSHLLAEQPSWSDLPVLVLSHHGVDAPDMRNAYLELGNVTLLERPLHSVTLVSAANSALRARRRQYAMREIDRRKDEFLAMLAHELRNPLAPVSAASDLLKMPNLNREKIQQTSAVISRQVKHMTGLIDDLLDVSRVSRGLVKLNISVVDGRQVVASAVEQVRPMFDVRRHQLTVRTPPETAYVEGDSKRLVQIVSNVLNNAAKYTPEGGEITLTMSIDPANLTFTVNDNGIGISSSVIPHIFDMFSQAERTADRTQGGLGIGLALVKNLVQLHGGTVTATSAGEGLGTEFQLRFPRCAPPASAPLAVQFSDAASTRGLHVLVVDDNVDAATMLGMFLEATGYRVQVVHTAGGALAIARQSERFDACLLDIGLPDMDGNVLAIKLRALSATSEAMLVAITGYGQEHDRAKTRAAGFDHHFVKPVDMDALLKTLAALDSVAA